MTIFPCSVLMMKTALRAKKVASALLKEDVSTDITDETLSLVISALGDSSLRAVQLCKTARDAWEILHKMYAGNTFMSRIGVLSNILNIKPKKEVQLSDHIARTKTKFAT